MCNPVLIGAALLASGTGAQIIGNNMAKRAVANTLLLEQNNQKRMTAQQDQALAGSMKSAQDLNNQAVRQEAIDRRKQAFMQALGTSAANQPIVPAAESAPAVVGDYALRTNAAEQADMAQQAGALANMTGFNDSLFNTQVGIGRGGEAIDQVARDKARSAEILNNELVHAQSRGGTLRGLGGIASTIGGMMLGANLKIGGSLGKAANATAGQSRALGLGGYAGPLG